MIRKLCEHNERIKIEKWKETVLVDLKNKNEETLQLIRHKADSNQRELKSKVYILRALYG